MALPFLLPKAVFIGMLIKVQNNKITALTNDI